MRTGTCKFGASCKYHHPRQGGGGGDSVTPVSLNYMGFPLRPVCSISPCSRFHQTFSGSLLCIVVMNDLSKVSL